MKTRFFLLVTLAISVAANGQTRYIGFQGGLSLANIHANDFYDNSSFKAGIVCEIDYKSSFSDRFNTTIGLSYFQNGFKDELIYQDMNGFEINHDEVRYVFDYLGLPIRFGIQAGKKIKGIVNVGVIPSLLVRAKDKFPDLDFTIENDEHALDIRKYLSKFDLAGLVELGTEYDLSNKFGIFALVGYRYSFTTVSGKEYFQDSKMRNYGYTFTLGARYKIK